MHSSKGLPINGMLQQDPSSSSQNSTSDNNANLNGTHQNKGAIPKTKISKSVSTNKKPTKFNNNVEEMLTSKCTNIRTKDVLHLHSDVLRINGYSEQLVRISSSYIDDFKSNLYINDDCENCSENNKTNGLMHENQFNNDIFTSRDENDYNKTCSKTQSYQESTSSRELDLTIPLKIDTESSSNSDDNELLSISDDGCIYTYKGDQAADLPSSFFSLDTSPTRSPLMSPQNRQDNASPEMDFLEMDFDPGPSGDADSDSQSNEDLENLPRDLFYKQKEQNNLGNYLDNKLQICNSTSTESENTNKKSEDNKHQAVQIQTIKEDNFSPSTSSAKNNSSCSNGKQESIPTTSSFTEKMKKLRMPWSCLIAQRTTSNSHAKSPKRYHYSHGELIVPSEKVSPNEDHIFESIDKGISEEDQVMIWSEHEATRKQITQIGASACGATAVLNVFKALRLTLPPIDKVREAIKTRLRANSSPLTEYLLSRSIAGCTHHDLIKGLNILSEGKLYARFFHMYPERVVNLYSWLKFWIAHGAIPIATLNLQKCSGTILDAWHHQMIFGVSPHGIYLTNPLECVDPSQLWLQLSSESALLVRREDILSRWNIKTDLRHLMEIKDDRWHKLNVVGQVANMVRESTREKRLGFMNTSHIKIPAAYLAGITLVIPLDSSIFPLLRYCPELPLLPHKDEAVGYSDVLF